MLSHSQQPINRLDLKNINSLNVPSGPPSPTLSTTSLMSSVSWMAEKTSNELIPMLKNAYCALKDKEKGKEKLACVKDEIHVIIKSMNQIL